MIYFGTLLAKSSTACTSNVFSYFSLNNFATPYTFTQISLVLRICLTPNAKIPSNRSLRDHKTHFNIQLRSFKLFDTSLFLLYPPNRLHMFSPRKHILVFPYFKILYSHHFQLCFVSSLTTV